MRRITYFIGNGFDLNVGLDTTYKKFYKYYKEKWPDDMLAKEIDENHLYWSDLELGLGRYTERVKTDEAEQFWESEEILEQELVTYLKEQMQRVNINDAERRMETALETQRSLTEFYRELPRVFQTHIENVMDSVREEVTYSFISFNYTNVLDQCLNATRKVIPGDFGKHSCNGGLIYTHRLGEVLHIHGTTDAEMVLGVNDESQITNKEFHKNTLYKQLLIKEETNKRFDSRKIEEACKIIDESIIICIYGMSIGQTDKKWWEYICKWLQDGEEKVLIIYTKTRGKRYRGKRTLFTEQDEMLNRLKNNANVSDEVWNQIKKQICVVCDSKIFRFKIIDN